MWVTVERITLNSDGGFLRGYGRTAALTTHPSSSPRLPPKRAKIAAKASATKSWITTLLQCHRLFPRYYFNNRNDAQLTRDPDRMKVLRATCSEILSNGETRRGPSITTKGGQGNKDLAKQRHCARRREKRGDRSRNGALENTIPAAVRS